MSLVHCNACGANYDHNLFHSCNTSYSYADSALVRIATALERIAEKMESKESATTRAYLAGNVELESQRDKLAEALRKVLLTFCNQEDIDNATKLLAELEAKT